MPDPELEARVAAPEARVVEVSEHADAARQDVAAARHPAAANDRDVADIRDDLRALRRATTSSFTAVREDLVDLATEVRGRFDQVAAGQERIVGLLTSVIEQGDS